MAVTDEVALAKAPAWPELSPMQREEALAAVRLPRLRSALIWAAALTAVTCFLPPSTSSAGWAWKAALSATLAATLLGFCFALRRRPSGEGLTSFAVLAVITVTHLNLMSSVMELAAIPDPTAKVVDPAFLFVMLIAGTLWACRVELSTKGFAWAAVLTAAILWLPWVPLTLAPVEFLLIGAACIGAGAQMRASAAQRVYERYRRETVWPMIWEKHVRAAVAKELARSAREAPADPAQDAPVNMSILRLAMALEASRANRYAKPPEQGKLADFRKAGWRA